MVNEKQDSSTRAMLKGFTMQKVNALNEEYYVNSYVDSYYSHFAVVGV